MLNLFHSQFSYSIFRHDLLDADSNPGEQWGQYDRFFYFEGEAEFDQYVSEESIQTELDFKLMIDI